MVFSIHILKACDSAYPQYPDSFPTFRSSRVMGPYYIGTRDEWIHEWIGFELMELSDSVIRSTFSFVRILYAVNIQWWVVAIHNTEHKGIEGTWELGSVWSEALIILILDMRSRAHFEKIPFPKK